MDEFTRARLVRFTEHHRFHTGELPTLQDYEKGGFSREQVELAVKSEILEQFYVTLTNGTIKKGFKLKQGQ